MENAAEALHMAFGVLIFVLALSISIPLFSQVRATSEYIIEANDRENEYIYITGNDTTRTVGVETIVPAMYRAYKEKYAIVFKDLLKDDVLYQKKVGNKWVDVKVLDLAESEFNITSQQEATKLIDTFLYGKMRGEENSIFPNVKTLHSNGFYDIIKENQFVETLGLYYIDDVTPIDEETDILSSDANKTEKRVITYTKK